MVNFFGSSFFYSFILSLDRSLAYLMRFETCKLFVRFVLLSWITLYISLYHRETISIFHTLLTHLFIFIYLFVFFSHSFLLHFSRHLLLLLLFALCWFIRCCCDCEHVRVALKAPQEATTWQRSWQIYSHIATEHFCSPTMCSLVEIAFNCTALISLCLRGQLKHVATHTTFANF